MPRKFFRKWAPSRHQVMEQKLLRPVMHWLADPNLWHLNRRSVSGGVATGLFLAFVPIPFQMLLAALAAIVLRVNLPLAVAMVWLTNPVTIPPTLWLAYEIGALILGTTVTFPSEHFTMHWVTEQLGVIWLPLGLGLLILGTFSAVVSFVTIRLLWRLHIVQHLRARQARRHQQRTPPGE